MIRKQLNALLGVTKNEIVRLITEKYLADNEGLFPNWADDEEIVVDDTDFPVFRISVDVDNTYDDTVCVERQAINEYRVTCDGNLFFVCGDYNNEIMWTEVNADELVNIYYNLLKGFTPTPIKKESFNCVTLSRADFEDRGFDTSNISDERMECISSKIGDTLVENLYWECIDVWGESEKMSKIKN